MNGVYSILIVDDEENIREGIAGNCDWARFDIGDVRTAKNGQDALDRMAERCPDLVISDIRMPVMGGLELAREAAERYPEALFAVLSGYDEFEYAQKLLQYNVREYLLKPCGVEKLHEVLARLTGELRKREQREQYLREMRRYVESMQHQLREQLIKDYITNSAVTFSEIVDRVAWGDLQDRHLRLLVFRIDGARDMASMLSLKALCDRHLKERGRGVHLSVLYNGLFLVLMDYYAFPELDAELEAIRAEHAGYYNRPVSVAVGERTTLRAAKKSYSNLLACMESAFYKESGCTITTFDLPPQDEELHIEGWNAQHLISAIRGGNMKEAEALLDILFEQLNNPQYSIAQVKAYSMDAYFSIIKLAGSEKLLGYLSGITRIVESADLRSVHGLIRQVAREIAEASDQVIRRSRSGLIKKTLKIIGQNLGNEALSRSMIAREMLFVNPDYLGKLFQQETGEKLSQYLTRLRIERAQALLGESGDIRIAEVSEKCGFGHNVQYFSKVFKRCTGVTPTEYRSEQRAQ